MQLRYEGTDRDAQADKMAPVSHARGQQLSCCHAYGMQRTLPILFHPMPVTLKCHIQNHLYTVHILLKLIKVPQNVTFSGLR